ncbi:hypothetical protein [Comamonas thiooxydans]|uniref:hypothetical protein n=1 Tax=Comamonas thiooxydans TaxID=363952 RepID=UPI000621D6EA|nr:hypothetical protein [Comamonas thiooxydans]KKI12323.1 hypothetical protein XA67_20065 [Comamonas thiooxydans]BCX53872.1 hypothetical protein CTYAZ2_34520 [Comamonas testosteroni]
MFGLSKPIPKDKGAKLAQAQNQAPDSIPGMFKPGEFVLPPDTVHAMGGKQALQGVVDATHTPVAAYGLNAPRASGPLSKAAPQLGLKPEVFFANGGAPEDQQPGLGLKPSAAPSPSNTFPGNRLPGNSGFSSSPPSAPAASTTPAPAGMTDGQRADALAQIPTGGPKAPAADGSQDSWSNTEAGRNVGNAVAALPGLGGVGRVASTGGAISRGLNAASAAVNNAGRVVNAAPAVAAGLYGSASPAAAASVAATPPATFRSPTNPAPASPTASTASADSAAETPSNQVMEGVYNHGRGQYSDQATGMGFSAGFTGKPSAQNNAAAGALAQPEAGGFGLKRPTQPEPGGFGLNVPTVSHSGNDWAARQRLKNLETSASSIMNTQRWGGRGAANNPATQNFLDASRADLAAQGKKPDMQMRTNEVNAGLQRAAMAEAGADRRAQGQIGLGLRRLDLDQQRNQLDAQRVASDERLRAPQIRAAERLGQLQEAYINAKTPAEQAALASQMRAYSGKDEADWKVQVTPAIKNLDGSTTAGSVIRYNSRTGDVQEVGGVGGKPQVPAKDSLKAGQVYQTPRGQARWNGTEFELVG